MAPMFDDALEWLAFLPYYVSPAIVFGLTAMAWQRHPHHGFLLLAISSMLVVLMSIGNAIMSRYTLSNEDQLAWWRCHTVLLVIDGVLYPWSLWLIFRHFREERLRGATDTAVAKSNPEP